MKIKFIDALSLITKTNANCQLDNKYNFYKKIKNNSNKTVINTNFKLNIMKKIYTIIAILFFTLSLSAQSNQYFAVNGIYYWIISSESPFTVGVIAPKVSYKYSGNITIPAQVIDNNITYSVTDIMENAFENDSNLTSITIPNSVTYIGMSAFQGCKGLTSLVIPNSVTSTSWASFEGCTGLSTITISNSLTRLESDIFSGCSKLESIIIPESITSIGDLSFNGCKLVKSFIIPNSVKTIGNWSFSHCDSLKSITLSNTLTSIGENAFICCQALTSIIIPATITNIGKSAFQTCIGLKSITCYASTPPTLGTNAFMNVPTTIPLYVYKPNVGLYSSTAQWKDFMISGIDNLSVNLIETNNLVIAPNPVKNKFTVNVNNEILTDKLVIELYTFSGEKVFVKQIVNMKESIDISKLQPGIYFVRMLNAHSIIGVNKIVKQ